MQISVWRLMLQALDDQFSLSSALPRTLVALLLQPGRLTREYMGGRIARYIPPFRLYLIASLLFFLLVSFFGQRGLARAQVALHESQTQAADSAPPSPPPWTRRIKLNTGIPVLDATFRRKLDEMADEDPRDAAFRLARELMDRAPALVFILLPIFALLFKLLYIRQKRFYVEHFIFALHVHSFMFLMF